MHVFHCYMVAFALVISEAMYVDTMQSYICFSHTLVHSIFETFKFCIVYICDTPTFSEGLADSYQ